MKTSDLIRWSGAALMLGGIFVAVNGVTHPLGETSPYYSNSLWVPSHLIGYAGLVLILFGLMGLYARHAEKAGRLGLLGFILVFVGGVTFAGGIFWIEVILGPPLAVNAPALLDSFKTSPSTLLPPALFLTFAGLSFLFFAGYIIFGVAMTRAAVLPRWVVWLVITSIIGILLFSGYGLVPVLVNIGIIVLGLSLVGWGYALRSEKPQAQFSVREHGAS